MDVPLIHTSHSEILVCTRYALMWDRLETSGESHRVPLNHPKSKGSRSEPVLWPQHRFAYCIMHKGIDRNSKFGRDELIFLSFYNHILPSFLFIIIPPSFFTGELFSSKLGLKWGIEMTHTSHGSHSGTLTQRHDTPTSLKLSKPRLKISKGGPISLLNLWLC